MDDTGELIDIAERVIVSPVGGVYQQVAAAGTIEAGDVIGHVAVAGGDTMPVRSPFRGVLVGLTAWSGERVAAHQRVAWLRVA